MSIQPSNSSIPDLLKIGSIPVNTAQDVETSVLEPVVHNDGFCRFVFQNKGILHSHSKIEIGLKNAPVQAQLPLGVGIYSLIDRVSLKMGTKTICEIEDFAHWFAYKSMFVSNENNKEREVCLTGRQMSHGFQYSDLANRVAVPSKSGGGESDTSAPVVGIDVGRDNDTHFGTWQSETLASDADNIVPLTSHAEPMYYSNLKHTKANDNPLYQLSLSELLPFLKMNQLPLYLIKEPVSLEIHFTQPGTGSVVADGSRRVCVELGQAKNSQYLIDTAATRLVADYIFYPQELMSAYANANQNMSFTYVDYQLSKMSVDAATAQSNMIRNIGGAGRIVSKMFWGLADEDCSEEWLLNNYYSQAPSRDYSTAGAVNKKNNTAEFNIKYNDNFLYPMDVKNTARHFHNVQSTEGIVPFVNREEYGLEGQSLTTRTILGYPQGGLRAGADVAPRLGGKFFWLGSRLNKNERINSRGVELYFKYEGLPAKVSTRGYTQRVYMEVIRTATLNNGYMSCYYA